MRKYKRKIVLLGDGAVGKTSLVKRYVSQTFSDEYIATIGANVKKKDIDYSEKDINLKMIIADLIGQQGYEETQKMNMVGSHGALLVSDLTRKETVDSLEDYWVPLLEDVSNKKPYFVFLANKSDLVDLKNEDFKEYRAKLLYLSEKYNSKFYFTSAKTGENVEKAFKDMGLMTLDSEKPENYYYPELYRPEFEITSKKALDLFESQLYLELGDMELVGSLLKKQSQNAGIDITEEKQPISKLEKLIENIKDVESMFLTKKEVNKYYKKRKGILNKIKN